ncbi:MAG: SGNH/GDSL hydrolase family protein [Oscillospiraceae bacterium]|nr:SGNH/GDSL hydrolase family protein [Oscillospiraceae bacterium]
MNTYPKRAVAVMRALSVIVLLFSLSACTSRKSEGFSRVYIALGDSVSAGYGILPEERHTDIFFETLKAEGYVDEYMNMAVNGCTTTMLLEYLKGMDKQVIANHFQNAHVITLNIGGNNILVPFVEHLPDVNKLLKSMAELLVFFSDSKDTISEVVDLTVEARELIENFSVFEILNLVSFIRKTIPLFDDIAGMYNKVADLEFLELVPLLSGSFSAELDIELQKGVDVFSREFSEIIKWLDTNAPNSIIIVNTVYNPVPQEFLGITLEMHDKARHFTQSINSVIFEENELRDFYISDVYSRFDTEESVTDILNFNFDLPSMTLNFDIIHPNSAGNKLIAELNYNSFKAYTATK